MPLETLFAFSVFAWVTSVTPGPNNFILLASGVNHGFRSCIPHMLGISSGFLVMVLAVGLGLAEVFTQLPWIYGAQMGRSGLHALPRLTHRKLGAT